MNKKTTTTILMIVLPLSVLVWCLYYFISFESYEEKRLHAYQQAMDIENPTTRNYAVRIAGNYQGELNVDQICEIYSHIYNHWKYVNDPRVMEYLSKASETIKNGLNGDCDDFAVLLASSLQSVGAKIRINDAYDVNKKSGHAFVEIYLNMKPSVVRERINAHYANFFQKLLFLTYCILILKKYKLPEELQRLLLPQQVSGGNRITKRKMLKRYK